MVDSLDFDLICRACLKNIKDSKSKSYLFDILQKKSGNIRTVSDLFQRYTLIELKADDSLPKNICYDCLTKFKCFHEFCNKCIESNETLLKIEQDALKNEPALPFGYDAVNLMKEDEQDEILIDPITGELNYWNKFNDNKNVIETLNTQIDEIFDEWSEENQNQDTIEWNKQNNYDSDAVDDHSVADQNSSDEADKSVVNGDNNDTRKSKQQLGRSKFECEVCKARFIVEQRLHAHMRTHSGLKPYPCTHCENAYTSKISLREHVLVNHPEDISKLDLNNEQSIDKSDSFDSNEESREKKTVKTESAVENDKIIMDNNAKRLNASYFQCELCNSRFRVKHRYDGHMRKHAGLKPYTCTVCHKSFCQAYYLADHMKIHCEDISKLPKYECDFCGRTFIQKVRF